MNMPHDDGLARAAIQFDIRRLEASGDAGALHFMRVLQFHPAHLNYKSRLSEQLNDGATIPADERSTLFKVGEVIRLLLDGQTDAATSLLSDIKPANTIDRLLVMLITAWCFPDRERFSEIDRIVQRSSTLSKDFIARIYIKLMTWAMNSGGQEMAAPYYDKALRNASGELAKAISTVGSFFGRESRIYFAPIRQRLVTYPWILDSVRHESDDLIIRDAKDQLTGPFTRTFFANPSALPREIQSAELQASWIGAYWILPHVWRTKGAILLTRAKDRDDLAVGITAWAVSRGPALNNLMVQHEHMLSRATTERILITDLLSGKRLPQSDWQELCSGIWDELPPPIAVEFVHALDIPEAKLGEHSYAEVDGIISFFNNLALVEREKWITRFNSLPSTSQLAIASLMPHTVAMSLPSSIKSRIRRLLLDAMGEYGIRGVAGGFAIDSLGFLISELKPNAKQRTRFLDLLEPEFAAPIALQHPDLVRTDLIEVELDRSVSSIQKQLAENKQGRWARYTLSPVLRAAQCMAALNKAHKVAIDAIFEVASSKYTTSDDVIDAFRALNLLSEERLLSASMVTSHDVVYRLEASLADRYWQGRNDLRAMNTVIAGLLSKYPETSRESIDQLVASARDPDIQVRLLAMEQLESPRVILNGRKPAIDATVLGAIYDPDSLVQAHALRLINLVSNDSIYRLAWARIINDWPTAHRRVRVAAAFAASNDDAGHREPKLTEQVLMMASDDRSLTVRRAASLARSAKKL